ncbi:MAG TPA: WhiB family transcriptional regulator, partial [Streptomyces sp.]|nr:WhiB family transcriptional regulator [Streptomyces sp.]
HRHWRYRGCAPVPAGEAEFPGQVFGDPALDVDAWHGADRGEVPEPQKERIARERAAVAVCGRCPVLAACRAWACSEDAEGRLREPVGIWGGMLALDRHRALIRRRAAAGRGVPVVVRDRLADIRSSPQKQALLAALARETDEELVAFRAGLDVRTANWQRSLLCGWLGLDMETATREELLGAARRTGVMPRGVRVRPDGAWPVVAAPTTDGARQRRLAPGMPVQLVLPVLALLVGVPAPAGGPVGSGVERRPGSPVSRPRPGPPSRPEGRSGTGPGRSRGRRGGLRVVRPPTDPLPLTLFPVAPAAAGVSSSTGPVVLEGVA